MAKSIKNRVLSPLTYRTFWGFNPRKCQIASCDGRDTACNSKDTTCDCRDAACVARKGQNLSIICLYFEKNLYLCRAKAFRTASSIPPL